MSEQSKAMVEELTRIANGEPMVLMFDPRTQYCYAMVGHERQINASQIGAAVERFAKGERL